MELSQALRLGQCPRLAIVGAGGKSTALFQLAREYPPPVIVTASAHLAVAQIRLADHHLTAYSPDDLNSLPQHFSAGVILVTGPIAGERTTGLSDQTLARLAAICQANALPLLIEADGSRHYPLKAPAQHEPPIPGFVDTVIVVAGFSGVGQPLSDSSVHRAGRFGEISGLQPEAQITPDALARVLNHPAGGLKNIPSNARRIALLTQINSAADHEAAFNLAAQLLPNYDLVAGTWIPDSAAPHKTQFRFGCEPIAGVVLAAGGAKRFGSPKQLLLWQQKPFVWHAAKTALDAGLWPVWVVTGAYSDEVAAAVSDLPVRIALNPDWADGQAGSVRTALARLPAQIGAAVFLLADQPQIPAQLIQELVRAHTQRQAPIIFPWVQGQRGNPVLFDSSLFSQLKAVSGDAGGRQLFAQHPVEKIPWDHPEILLDVDTPEDYATLTQTVLWESP